MPTEPSSQTCCVCGDPAIVHVHLARDRKWVQVYHTCQQHVDEILVQHFSANPVSADVGRPFEGAIPFDVELLLMPSDGPRDGAYYLRQRDSNRCFCSTMAYCESAALYWNIQGSLTTRPGTHATFGRTITLLGGSVQDVLIHRFNETEKCFEALIRLKKADELVEVDARPSDAINLAVVSNAPIFVSQMAWHTYEKAQSQGAG